MSFENVLAGIEIMVASPNQIRESNGLSLKGLSAV